MIDYYYILNLLMLLTWSFVKQTPVVSELVKTNSAQDMTVVIVFELSMLVYRFINTNMIQRIRTSLHKDFADLGMLGVLFNRYVFRVECYIILYFLAIFYPTYPIHFIVIFAIIYEISKSSKACSIDPLDFEDPKAQYSPSFAQVWAQSVGLTMNELTADQRQERLNQMNIRLQQLELETKVYIKKMNELRESIKINSDAASDVKFSQEEIDNMREEIKELQRKVNGNDKEATELQQKWFSANIFENQDYVNVRIKKLEDIEKYAQQYDHMMYTAASGKITFTSKVWKKFEHGLYSETKHKTFANVQVTTDSKFVNMLCVHANASIQRLLTTPPKVESKSFFGISKLEKRLFTRCYYARRLYNHMTSQLIGKCKFVELMNPQQFEALVAFACANAFMNRGLGKFEHWMTLDSNEYFEDMGFTFEN